LHDELAFEVRWAVAGESIVIQLVAKLGEFIQAYFNKVNVKHERQFGCELAIVMMQDVVCKFIQSYKVISTYIVILKFIVISVEPYY